MTETQKHCCSNPLTRRSFLVGVAATITACGGGSGGTTADNVIGQDPRLTALGVGCYKPAMAGFDSNAIGCGLQSTFGDPWFDQRFGQEVMLQVNFFQGFSPGVYILDECSPNQANALSDPRGFILFGRWLTSKTIIETGSELPIAGILAHEFAHQLQFYFGWINPSEATARRTELEADMWSGYYMGLAKAWAGPELNAYFQTLFQLGDFQFNAPGHHGTPNQRLAAGATGMTLAQQVLISGQRLGYQDIHFLFDREINRIVQTAQFAPVTSTKVPSVEEGLSYPINVIAPKMDTAWIEGVARGERSVEELKVMPSASPAQRQILWPY